jgi:hypothetical protein
MISPATFRFKGYDMERLLAWVGNLAAAAGVLVCLITGVVRLGGAYRIVGFELETLFMVGIGLMVMGILAKLQGSSTSPRP